MVSTFLNAGFPLATSYLRVSMLYMVRLYVCEWYLYLPNTLDWCCLAIPYESMMSPFVQTAVSIREIYYYNKQYVDIDLFLNLEALNEGE